MSFKLTLKTIYHVKKEKGKSFWLHGDGLKCFLTMNPMEKKIKRMNTTSEYMKYLVNNKTLLCHHKNCTR